MLFREAMPRSGIDFRTVSLGFQFLAQQSVEAEKSDPLSGQACSPSEFNRQKRFPGSGGPFEQAPRIGLKLVKPFVLLFRQADKLSFDSSD